MDIIASMFDFSYNIKKPLHKGEIKMGNYPVPSFPKCNETVCLEFGSSLGGFIKKYGKNFTRMYSFEASYTNYRSTQKLIDDEGLENCKVFNLAGYGKTGELLKLEKGESPNGNIIRKEPKNEYQNVLTINFDDTIKLINEEKINYLKIDIEGSEYSFLKEVDLTNVDVLSMEIHSRLGKPNELEKHIKKYMDVYKKNKGTNYEITFTKKDLPKGYLIWPNT